MKARQTSRGFRDMSHDERCQPGASARSVPISSLVLRRQRGEAEMPTEAAGFWGPRCSVLDHWLRREAKPERTLGPGATVGVLGMGVPRLACLRPTAWRSQQAVRPIFINKASKTLARGRASRGGRCKTSSGVA